MAIKVSIRVWLLETTFQGKKQWQSRCPLGCGYLRSHFRATYYRGFGDVHSIFPLLQSVLLFLLPHSICFPLNTLSPPLPTIQSRLKSSVSRTTSRARARKNSSAWIGVPSLLPSRKYTSKSHDVPGDTSHDRTARCCTYMQAM